MLVVFHSNYLNHHQKSFLESLKDNGCQVYFIAHGKISEERKALGYSTEGAENIQIQYSEETKKQVYDLTMAADAVIFGSKPQELFQQRVRSGKLTFNYSERLFKKNPWTKYSPIHQIRLRKTYLFDRKNAPYLLAAGVYAAQDYKSLGYPKDRFLKWGYFPPITQTPLEELLRNKKQNTIIWVGRFIDWKHPEYVVELGQYLKNKDISFHIKMIGTGELLEPIKALIASKGLTEAIDVPGAMPPEQVRKEFDSAQIALMTSDQNEGWGAVVNEAMNGACAMVASDAVGSTSYLIQDHINGLTYGKHKEQMFRGVEQLLQNHGLCWQFGEAAYHTIMQTWNYQVAAERFVAFVHDNSVRYTDGPLSKG